MMVVRFQRLPHLLGTLKHFIGRCRSRSQASTLFKDVTSSRATANFHAARLLEPRGILLMTLAPKGPLKDISAELDEGGAGPWVVCNALTSGTVLVDGGD